jgi:hypothetical protein
LDRFSSGSMRTHNPTCWLTLLLPDTARR